MTPNQRLVRIQRTIADSWRRKIKVIEDGVENLLIGHFVLEAGISKGVEAGDLVAETDKHTSLGLA